MWALREAGEKEAVIIFGTLWIVDELIKYEVISKAHAKKSFELMKERKRRLPWEIIEKRYR